MARKLILIDANLLMLAMAGKLNLSVQLREAYPQGLPHVPLCVLDELARMDEPLAAAARELAMTFPLFETPQGPADDLLLDYAKKEGFLVATNDGELIKQIRETGAQVLCLKGKHRLVLEGGT